MIDILIIIFTMSLIYLASGGRLYTYVRLLILQGLLLFGIAAIELLPAIQSNHIDVPHLIFILVETLVVKALVIPYFLYRVIRKSEEVHEIEPDKSNFSSVLAVSAIMVGAFIIAYSLHDEHLKITYFTASISAIFAALFTIITRKKVITHVMCFMVLENGIFLLSLAIGKEMPAIVSTGILLDLFTSVLVLGMFVNRIRELFNTTEVEKLSGLKD